MTISSTLNRVAYVGNGATTAFAVSFPFHAQADLVVIETIIATGVQTLKTITTHYTISGSTDALGHYSSGGTVNAVTAPASTVRWTIYRDPTRTQALNLVENDSLPAENVEAQFDYLTMIVQRVADLIGRTLRQPDGDADDIATIPSKVDRASKYLAYDADGDPVATAGTTSDLVASAFVETVLDDADGSAVLETIIDSATEETAPAIGDLVPISDVSANNGRKMTLPNLLKVINALTEDATPDKAADYVLTYDTSASGVKKALPDNLIPAASTTVSGRVELATQAEVAAGASSRVATTDLNSLDLQTPQATTSGTSFSFTGVPTGTRRVTVQFAGVSLSSTANFLVQIGPVAGVETSGYVSSSVELTSTPANNMANSTAGFIVRGNTASGLLSGTLVLTLMNASTNQWVASGSLKNTTALMIVAGGDKTIAGALSVVKILNDGADTFDAGAVNVMYER